MFSTLALAVPASADEPAGVSVVSAASAENGDDEHGHDDHSGDQYGDDGHDHSAAELDPDQVNPDGNALGPNAEVYWANKDYVEYQPPAEWQMESEERLGLMAVDETLVHKLRVVYFTKQGSEPSNPATDQQLRNFFEGPTGSISRYWSDQTNGAISLEVQDITRMSVPSTFNCVGNSGGDVANNIGYLWARAKTQVIPERNLQAREHIMVVWPDISGSSCTFGLAGAPSQASLNHGGFVFAKFGGDGQPMYLSANGFSHEFGHNLGLLHSHGVYCTDGNGESENDRGCTHDEYGDYFDTMGRNDDGGIPQISTSAKDKLGVLARTVTTVTMTSGTREFTLEPLNTNPNANADDNGIESVKVVDPANGRPYYVELRAQSTDWRAVPFGWVGFPNTSVNPRDSNNNLLWPRPLTSDYGVRILRIGTESSQGGHALAGGRLGQNPITMQSGSVSRNVWLPGEEFVTRTGNIRIQVVSKASDNTSAVVRISLPDSQSPVISGATNRTIEARSVPTFDVRAGVAAIDDGDGDLTAQMVVSGSVNVNVPGIYVVSYTVKDLANNAAQVYRTITVVDTTRPVLTVPGNTDLALGASFDPRAGVSASDTVDGNLTDAVAITGQVNTSVPGEYTLTYSVADSSSNAATATRSVRVLEPVVIDPGTPGGGDTGGGDKPGAVEPGVLTQTGPNRYETAYGRAISIPVRVGTAAQAVTGTVTVRVGTRLIGSVPVRGGSATAVLPATLKTGTHQVSLAFLATGSTVPVTRVVQLRVRPAATAVKVSAPKRAKVGTRLRVRAKVTATGATVAPKGSLRVYVGKKRVATVKVKSGRVQVIKLKAGALPKRLRGKSVKVTVRYAGTQNFRNAKSKTLKVAVRR